MGATHHDAEPHAYGRTDIPTTCDSLPIQADDPGDRLPETNSAPSRRARRIQNEVVAGLSDLATRRPGEEQLTRRGRDE